MGCLDRASLVTGRSLTLGDVLPRFAALRGDRVLVTEAGHVLTFAEAAERHERLAAGIAAATRPGDRVVVATPNTYDQLLVSLAACRAGAVAVPVNSHMRPEEIDHVVNDSGAALVIRAAEEVLARSPLPAAEVERLRPLEREVGAIFYTSGTTGRPKGAEL